ncbi:MAG TPA: SDR family oxidoreductase [Jatrophihabitantaceae bacterium]
MKIVVIGGTGLVGSKLVTQLSEQGHDAVAASPNTGVNTVTGAGLANALAGAAVVVDVSNSPSWEDAAVLEFFRTSTRNLLAAETNTGVGHHVALSIVGTERLPDSGYLRAKVAQEKLIEASTVPYSLVHATQFFEFVAGIADGATEGNTVRMPPVGFQPIAAEDVAQAVARVATGAPLNGRVEVAGPQRYRMDEFFRKVLAERDDPREVVTDEHARYFGTELGEGSLVPAGEAILGQTNFDDWRGDAGNYPVARPTT